MNEQQNSSSTTVQKVITKYYYLKTYETYDIPWTNILTNISTQHTQENTKITFSHSFNSPDYITYSVSDVFELKEPLDRSFYIPSVNEDETIIFKFANFSPLTLHKKNNDKINEIEFDQSSPNLSSNTYKYVIVAIKEKGSDKLNKYFFIETNPKGDVKTIR